MRRGFILFACGCCSANHIIVYLIYLNAPPVSYLLFADDPIIFCGVTEEEALALRSILNIYEDSSCQQVNLAKSNILFGKGVPQHKVLILDIQEVLSYNKYLGLPTKISESTKKPFYPSRTVSVRELMGG